MKPFKPEFIAAMMKYKRLASSLGDDHPRTKDAFAAVLLLTPDDMVREFMKNNPNLLPKPNAYTGTGAPLYTVDSIAAHYGISLEDTEKQIKRLGIAAYDGDAHPIN